MDDILSIDLFQRNDALCWKEAVETYNKGLKNGELNKKYIHLGASGAWKDQRISAEELMRISFNSYQRLEKKRSPIASFLVRVYDTVQRHGKAIDVFVQCDPTIAGLVWGSVRILLQIVEDDLRASEIAGEGILEILYHVGRWEQVSGISELLNSPTLRMRLINLYVKVLDFLVSATHWFRRNSLHRLGHSMLSSKADKFEDKLKRLKAASDAVDKEAQTRATYKGLDSFRTISFDIRGTMDKMDTMLQQVQHLSDTVIHSQLCSLTTQKTNILTVEQLFKELRSLPYSISNLVFGRTEGMADFTEIKSWLKLGAVGTRPRVSRAEGTREWLLSHPSFVEWRESNGKNILWIHGQPGFGKTVMAGYIQEQLSSQNIKTFFYQFERSASTFHSTPTTFASSLILQLLGHKEAHLYAAGALEQLQALSAQCPLGPQNCSFNTIWEVAASLLVSSGFQYSIVIDAIDECMFGGPSQPAWPVFLQRLSRISQDTQSKLLILSRPEPRIKSTLHSELSIDLTVDLVLPDIMKLAGVLYDEFMLPKCKKRKIMKRVRDHSHGSFQWTWLFLDYLGNTHQKDFDIRLHTLPPSLSDLYKEALIDSTQVLDNDRRACQKSIFQMSYQAQRPLRVTEVGDALLLRSDSTETIISDLCKPFITTDGGFIKFTHPTVLEFFESYDQPRDEKSPNMSFMDADGFLAERCLATLLDDRYSSLERIGRYLRANYNQQPIEPGDSPPDHSFYNYASQYWDHHLTRTKSPSEDLLRQLSEFLQGLQFSFWAEYSLRETGQLVSAVRAFNRVQSWLRGLSDAHRSYIHLEKFFACPYQQLSVAFTDDGKDEVLQWLAQMSLGNYYFTAAVQQEATIIRENVSSGLQALLGPENPLSLRARADLAFERLSAGRMREARRMYREVAAIQERVLGENNLSFLETLIYKGESEYFMGDFSTALVTFTQVLAKLLKLTGPETWQYLAAQWWHAKTLAQIGQFHTSLETMKSVSQKRRDQFGAEDPFHSVVQRSIGETLRLLDRHEESISVLEEVIEKRRKSFELSSAFRLDTEIALAFSYLAGNRDQDAKAIVEEIEQTVNLVRSDLFERACLFYHLKGILLAKEGSINQAINLLQNTLIQVDLDQNNRALLWIRLDLADLLCDRGSEGDGDQASSNFDRIVRCISDDSEPRISDEPDSPRILAVAERVLRLVRARKYGEALKVLESEQVEWMRPSDFWLWNGGADFSC